MTVMFTVSSKMVPVLGLARTGLIFTRSQEGTQANGLTQPGQTEQGIRHRVLPCWVLVGELAGGKFIMARECAGNRGVRIALSMLLFFLYILLMCIVVVTVRFLFAVLFNSPYPNP